MSTVVDTISPVGRHGYLRFRVSESQAPIVSISFPEIGVDELAFRAGDFTPRYKPGSSVTLDGSDYVFSVKRQDGWIRNFTFHVDEIAVKASQIQNDSSVSGSYVKDALNSLLSSIGALVTGVSSFKGRTGAISPAAGDYYASEVSNDSDVAGTYVSDGLNTVALAASAAQSTATSAAAAAAAAQTDATDALADAAAAQSTANSKAAVSSTAALAVGDAASAGISADAARVDHVHTAAASHVSNDSSVSGSKVKDALNTLSSAISALVTGVSSFKTRTGAITPAAGDYAASQVTNDSSTVTGTYVSNALDTLKALFSSYMPTTWTLTAGNGLTGGGTGAADRTLTVLAADSSITVAAGGISTSTTAIGAVPTSRTISAGNGLTGGGALSANRTLTVLAADSSITVAAGGISTSTTAIGAVPTSRTVTAGNGLTGGGALSSNVTLTALAADASVTVSASGISILPPVARTSSSTSLTVAAGDAYGLVICTGTTAISLTIDTDANLSFPVGGYAYYLPFDAGQITVSAVTPGTTNVQGGGGTGSSGTGALKSYQRNLPIILYKKAANVWLVWGATTT